MGSNPTVGVWYRGVMASQRIANPSYRNVVRVRVTAIPLCNNSDDRYIGGTISRETLLKNNLALYALS